MQRAFELQKSTRILHREAALIVTGIAAVALIAIQLAGLWVSPVNAGLVDLLLVLLVASRAGIRGGLIAAAVGALGFNFLFLAPIFRFAIADSQHIAAIPVFLAAAVIGASLTDAGRSSDARVFEGAVESPAKAPVLEMPVALVEVRIAAPLSIDSARRQVHVDGAEVRLTPTEFNLLELFVENSGRILTRDAILGSVWGDAYVGDVRILRTYINQLRTKLGDNASAPRFIRTEPGFGYRFVGPGA